jgi:hypothetical protein
VRFAEAFPPSLTGLGEEGAEALVRLLCLAFFGEITIRLGDQVSIPVPRIGGTHDPVPYLDAVLQAVELAQMSVHTLSSPGPGRPVSPPSTSWQSDSRPGRLHVEHVSTR